MIAAKGVGTAGQRGARLRNAETAGAKVSFRPRNNLRAETQKLEWMTPRSNSKTAGELTWRTQNASKLLAAGASPRTTLEKLTALPSLPSLWGGGLPAYGSPLAGSRGGAAVLGVLRRSPRSQIYAKFCKQLAVIKCFSICTFVAESVLHLPPQKKTRKPSCRWQTRATLAKSLHGLRKSSGVVSCIARLPIDSVPMVSYYVLCSNCVCKMRRFGDTRLLKLPWP